MGDVEDMRRKLEQMKAREEVRADMRKRNAERRQLKRELRAKRYWKTAKVLRGTKKTGKVVFNVLGALGDTITQQPQQTQQPVRRVVRRAPVRRVVRRAPVRRVVKRKPVRSSRTKKPSDDRWWLNY